MVQPMPGIDVFGIGNEIALPELYAQCVDSLRDRSRMVVFVYPEKLRNAASTDTLWAAESTLIRESNADLLLGMSASDINCYAIHTRTKNEDWRLRYIGQTDSKRAKSNIMRCLVPHGGRPDAVFKKCKEAVRGGCEIGLRMIKVEPGTLRSFIHEKMIAELLSDKILDWNHK
jgi:hypothetical protein